MAVATSIQRDAHHTSLGVPTFGVSMSHFLHSRRTRTRLALGSAVLGVAALCLGGQVGAAATSPGTPATTATCPAPDARPSVVFLDLDSGVANSTLSSGCTINDVIDDERTWPAHGAFVAHVRSVTAELVATGEVTRAEAGRLQSAAARSQVGKVEGYDWLFDGSAGSFDDWAYAGDGGFDLVPDGTIRSRAGAGGGFGTLWYPAREFGDFSLRLQFRDDAPGAARGNSGVQVRFPELWGPVE